tara:strand:+ start:614 stop:949 length:336 start_codon:yes stop_codon:yes gene_type:complete
MSIINFQEYKEKLQQKEADKLELYLNSITESLDIYLKQQIINDLDIFMHQFRTYRKDLEKIIFFEDELLDPFYFRNKSVSDCRVENVTIPKQEYQEYIYLKKLLSELKSKY